MMKTINLKRLITSLMISILAGVISSILTVNPQGVFNTLIKPPLTPPAWVFPIVWTILYILIGIAAYLITDSRDRCSKSALKWYYIQLAFNVIWSPIFFNFRLYWVAMFVLILLWATAFITAIKFNSINKNAGIIMMIYMVWLSFAAYLNMGIACLN